MKKFSLIALRILPECNEGIQKVLKEGKPYFFNNKYIEGEDELVLNQFYSVPENFYSEKININAIVGKNGSGKSSVIETLLRLVNNLSFLLFKKEFESSLHEYPDLDTIYNLNAELFYEIVEVSNEGVQSSKLHCLRCNNDRVYINQGNGFIHLGEFDDLYAEKDGECLGELELTESLKILREFFFTIVSNYSFHAYNANDYINESSGKDINFGNPDDKKDRVWIDKVFHKNDGYLTPLVLNPYRDKGIIDVESEKNLTNFRLAFLFYYFHKQGIEFMDSYTFNSLSFKYNKEHVTEKYKIKNNKTSSKKEIIEVFIDDEKNDIFNFTLRCYDLKILNNDKLIDAYKYLVYKTFSISYKYPNYTNFIDKSQIQFNDYLINEDDKLEIKKLVDKILDDYSHTTLKIRQTINFIKYIADDIENSVIEDYNSLEQDYIQRTILEFSSHSKLNDIDKLLVSFPPPFYRIDINLFNSQNVPITFNHMSSGERQFLFYLSTLLYHLKNLDTVVDDSKSVHYNIVNIVLEEVELYFHPEYQRQFIQKLIHYLIQGNFTRIDYFNIVIATHSPFILSDIPKENIMFLEEGEQKDIDIDTFGANIHDLLRHSFFLRTGLMGDFSKDRINKIINDIEKDGQSEEEKDRLYKTIQLIGDNFIKEKIENRFLLRFYDDNKYKEKKIAEYKEKIKALENVQSTDI